MRPIVELFTRNMTLKLIAAALALLLWTVVKADEPTRVAIPNVPVEVALRDPGWTLSAPPSPGEATVVFTGPVRELVRLAVARPRIIVPVDRVEDSLEVRPLRTAWVQLDGDLSRTRTEDVRPASVMLTFERLTTRLLPTAVRLEGELPPGLSLAGPVRVDPPGIRVSGPARRLVPIDSVRLVPLRLDELRGPSTAMVPVDTAGLSGLMISPRRVEVFVPVAAAEPSGAPAADRPREE